jgi:hypothetical protein
VDAATFLREARWANETYHLAQLDTDGPDQLQAFFREAHLNRLRSEYRVRVLPDRLREPSQLARFLRGNRSGLDNQGKVHFLLAATPLPPLKQVYKVVFERVLNEKITPDPVAVVGR